MDIYELYAFTVDWLNNNQGVLTLVLFVLTIVFGWVSGIFALLKRRPQLKIEAIEGPTFCCSFMLNQRHENQDLHRTCIVIYLKILNIGSAPTNIENISVGYHCHLKPISWQWFKYSIGWLWLDNPTVALSDFFVNIGDKSKIFPFLMQRSHLLQSSAETYLEVGKSTSGIVYFEQPKSWGGFFPTVRSNGKVTIKVRVKDAFGSTHSQVLDIPSVSLEYAKKFNPEFGMTLMTLDADIV